MTYTFPADYAERPVAVIGAGTLGRRIALMYASRGGVVRIYDLDQAQAEAAVDYVKDHAIGDGARATLEPVSSLEDAVKDAWMVVEVVPERVELKKEIFGTLDRIAGPDSILASNSSSYPSSQFIDNVSDEGRRRVVNTHYYMPPEKIAVEIGSCGYTDDAVISGLESATSTYGLVPFIVHQESVGFIFNRVWAAVKRECLAVVAEGVSTPSEVDRMWSVMLGGKGGPFRQMDQVGLDVILDIEEHYAEVNPHLPEGPRQVLHRYIDAGKLGIKSGSGFYDDYTPAGSAPAAVTRAAA